MIAARRNVLIWSVATVAWLMLSAVIGTLLRSRPACVSITRLPFLIEASGCYRLATDLALNDSAGAAIRIHNDRVRLDLNGHRISGPSNLDNTSVGIAATGVTDVLVKNGVISGFREGVQIERGANARDSNHFVLQDVSLIDNRSRGALIEGAATLVERVRVRYTPGFRAADAGPLVGIELKGADCRVLANGILETRAEEASGTVVSISRIEDAAVVGCLAEKAATTGSFESSYENPLGLWIRMQIRYAEHGAQCKRISGLPYNITASGCYEMLRDLAIEKLGESGIVIAASNVTLNLNGHRLSGPFNLMGSGAGVAVEGQRNVSVENGSIAGFLYGVRAGSAPGQPGSDRFRLRNMAILDNGFRGVTVRGANAVVENVTVERTGGTHLFPDASAIGIDIAGPDCSVRDNRVMETHPVGNGDGSGIWLAPNSERCAVMRNEFQNTFRNGDTRTVGIAVAGNALTGLQLSDNRIEGFARVTNIASE